MSERAAATMPAPAEGDESSAFALRRSPGGKRLVGFNFSNKAERAAHVAAFLAWLPQALRAAPGVDWAALPSRIMGFLMNTADTSPDRERKALAVACAERARAVTLYNDVRMLHALLNQLRHSYGVGDLADLRTAGIWRRYAGDRDLTPFEASSLLAYGRYANVVMPHWLESLAPSERVYWADFVLPRPPARMVEQFSQQARIEAESRERRKGYSDTLVPLFPLLVTLAELRKQAMQRLQARFAEECRRAERGEVTLPHTFALRETLRDIAADALTLAEARLVERTVVLNFTLWDRRSWVLAHPDRYGATTQKRAVGRYRGSSYAREREHYFLQFIGEPTDLYWFGDIIATGALHQHAGRKSDFIVSRSGILQPPGSPASFLLRGARQGELLLDPESLYRGVLYGAALAAATLTNACRLNELLQISMESYVVELVPEFDGQLQKTGRLIPCVFQKLLPKGAAHESERQLFLITTGVAELLNEIAAGLEAAHGEVPVVQVVHSSKAEDLQPARYLFQWAASDDGQKGLIMPEDVISLLRFLFHGLRVTTAVGEPIALVPHLLRHVAATHARQVRKVPGEIVAHHLLHHKLVRSATPGPRRYITSAVTDYYTRLPQAERLGLLYAVQERYGVAAEEVLILPDADDLDAMERHFRDLFAQWGAIAPVTFGWCGAPGLCVRPDNRGHCLGCGYLQPDWRRFANIAPYREIYQRLLVRSEEQGLHTEARQAGQHMTALDGLTAVMRAQYVAWKDRQEGSVVDRVLGADTQENHVPVGIDG